MKGQSDRPAILSASRTKGRYRHAAGDANIPVTRKIFRMGPPQWKSRANSWLKRVTESSTEPNHRPMRPSVFIKLVRARNHHSAPPSPKSKFTVLP